MCIELPIGQLHLRREHPGDLLLVRLAVAGEDDLDLRGLVLEDGYPAFLEHHQDGAARLRDADGARRVATHEELLERCLRGPALDQ